LYAGWHFWLRPLDDNQTAVLRALIHEIAVAERLPTQQLWAGVHRQYDVRSFGDLGQSDYRDLVDQLTVRARR